MQGTLQNAKSDHNKRIFMYHFNSIMKMFNVKTNEPLPEDEEGKYSYMNNYKTSMNIMSATKDLDWR